MIDLKNPTIVLANGEFPKHQSASDLLNFDYNIICTDGSADKLEEHGIPPKIIIGDFDSTKIIHKKSEALWIERPDQNKTDLEKAFESVYALKEVDLKSLSNSLYDFKLVT